MATKRIQIEFDLNTNDVKIASEATLTLAQQVRILKQELGKTKEGTREFDILKNKLNETRDNFERVNVKSRELFGTLSLLPGPVGEIAGKLNGAISLMKVFSGFSFKDIQGQFKALANDIGEIFKNISRWGEESEDLKGTLDDLTNTTKNNIGASTAAAAQIQANIKAETSYVDTLQDKIKVEKQYQEDLKLQIARNNEIIQRKVAITKEEITAKEEALATNQIYNSELQQSIAYEKRYSTELRSVTGAQKENTKVTEQNTQAVNTDSKSQVVNSAAKKSNSVVTNLLTTQTRLQALAADQAAIGNTVYATTLRGVAVAAGAAATAIRLFKAVLISTGIGLLIVGLSELLTRLYQFVAGSDKAEAATKAFNDELERQNDLIDSDASAMKRANELKIAELKASGADERRIRQELLKQRQADLDFARQNEAKAAALYNKSLGKADEQTLKTLNDNLRKRQELTREAQKNLRLQTLEGFEQDRKDRIEEDKKREERTKKALDAAIELEIREKETNAKKLRQLLNERYQLEIKDFEGSEEEKLLIKKGYDTKFDDAIKEDSDKKRQDLLADYDALAEIERNREEVDVERLIAVLKRRREVELKEEGLTYDQKQAILMKSEAEYRKLRQEAREKQLVEDIQANRDNFEKQIELYRKFGDEVIKSNNYNEAEKLKIIQENNQRIQELEKQRFDNEKTKLDLQLQDNKLTYTQYFDELDLLYQQEIQRTEEQYRKKEIIEAEYNKRIKELTDARNNIRQQELEAQIATFQAIGQGLGAISQLVGEQTRQGKAFAVAASLINTYAAIAGQLRTFSGPGAPPIPGYAIAQAIATGLVGFAQVRKILATQVPGGGSTTSQGTMGGGTINVNQRRAQGGMIFGPGGDTSDSIPAMLSNGEFVVNARSTRVFRPLLESMNSAANLPQFAVGGLVTGGGMNPPKSQNETLADAISNAFGSTPIRTYVTANEVSTQQQFDRIIKSRSLI